MDLLGSYSSGVYGFYRRVDHGFVSPLSQDCRERILRTPSTRHKFVCFLQADLLLKGYPDEWFPSVSATIGDRYPERSVFQLFIAMTSGNTLFSRAFRTRSAENRCVGPRFALVFLWYILTARLESVLPNFVVCIGLFRTLMCGGWTYVTSTDDHGWHDVFMISYLVATLPWTLGCIALSPKGNPKALKYRKILAGSFFGALVPLIFFFIQHKVHKVAGGQIRVGFQA